MSFTKSTVDVDNVRNLAVQVVEQAVLVQTAMDQYGIDDVTYINQHVDELESVTDGNSGMDNVGVTPIFGMTATTPQTMLEELKTSVSGTKPTLNIFSALDYGLTGLGIADDAIAWNTLLTTIGSTKATILFTSLMTSEAVYLISTNVVVPGNITLAFHPGSTLKVSNGITITGDNTKIAAGLHQIFDLSLGGTVIGTWGLNYTFPQWFGAKNDGVTDSYAAIQYAINFVSLFGGIIYFTVGTYLISNSLHVLDGVSLIGEKKELTFIKKTTHDSFTADTVLLGSETFDVDDDTILNLAVDSFFLTIKGLTLYSGTYDGNANDLETNLTLTNFGIYSLNSGEFTLEDVNIYGCKNSFYLLTPYQSRVLRCRAFRAREGFYVGFHTGGASGTTTLFQNCYVLTCYIGFSLNGAGTIELQECSVDFAKDGFAYVVNLCNQIQINNCSSEKSGSVILRVIDSNGVYVNGLRAYSVDAYDPIANKSAPFLLTGSEVIMENCIVFEYINVNGSPYPDDKDLYNLSLQSTNAQTIPFNVKFINCVFPTNAKTAYVNGDLSGLSSIMYYNKDGTERIYPSIDTTVFSITNAHNVELNNPLIGTITWDPINLIDGAGESSLAITVTGASLGDFVQVSAPYNLWGVMATAYVSAINTAVIRIENNTGVAVDLVSGDWKVLVTKV